MFRLWVLVQVSSPASTAHGWQVTRLITGGWDITLTSSAWSSAAEWSEPRWPTLSTSTSATPSERWVWGGVGRGGGVEPHSGTQPVVVHLICWLFSISQFSITVIISLIIFVYLFSNLNLVSVSAREECWSSFFYSDVRIRIYICCFFFF